MIPKIIYIQKGPKNYLKLCKDPEGGRNQYGLIEKDGTLCGTRRLGYFKNLPGYTLSPNGASRSCGGTGYDGWVKFSDVDTAVEFLEQHYIIKGYTRNKIGAILESRGLTPTPLGEELPHNGLDGSLFRKPNDPNYVPVYAAPPLPNVSSEKDPAEAQGLLDDWFNQIKDILAELKSRPDSVQVAFLRGGTAPISDWFCEWCKQEGIKIMTIEPRI
jgi:hypothetical protein